jgi:PPK2 family polyphosphate:nucleotide phosphotransferase
MQKESAGKNQRKETNMKINTDDFRVKPGEKVKLKNWSTRIEPLYKSKDDYKKAMAEHIEKLSSLQSLLYADNQYALLLIFQAMDAAGKDGAIKHVMSGVNPQGCQVFSFKHPSSQELQHDFLWRTTRDLPERGKIGIFNRSYYEEVLIARVHPEILKAEQIPEELLDKEIIWEERFHSIVNLEEHLHCNGTKIIKFFLHISKEEQRKRFLDRLDKPEKYWKFSPDDIGEREYWKEYREAYEDCLGATSTKNAPWYVVPADDKKDAWLIISQIIMDSIEKLKLEFPVPDRKLKKELEQARKILKDEGKKRDR